MSDELVKRLRDNASNLQCAGFVEAPEVMRQAVTALSAARAEIEKMRAERDGAYERCARHFEGIAKIHAQQATWMGPERQRYEGPRIPGVEMSPMNGPAISYDREMAHAAACRALRAQDGGR